MENENTRPAFYVPGFRVDAQTLYRVDYLTEIFQEMGVDFRELRKRLRPKSAHRSLIWGSDLIRAFNEFNYDAPGAGGADENPPVKTSGNANRHSRSAGAFPRPDEVL